MSFILRCTCGPDGASVIGRDEADAWRQTVNASCGACRQPATRLTLVHVVAPRRVVVDAFSDPGEMMPASPLRSALRPPPAPPEREEPAGSREETVPLGDRFFTFPKDGE